MKNFISKLTAATVAIALPTALVVFGGITGAGIVVAAAVIIATN